MHWILTISNRFSLAGTLRRSRSFLLPPFALNRSQDQLLRVERLISGQVIALSITQTHAGLLIQANKRLSGPETEEASRKVRRMLRLGENFTDFVNLAHAQPALQTVVRQGAHLLRGTNLFEDTIKILLLTQESMEVGTHHITWLVDRLGDPLPNNPSRHAFPTPQQVLWGGQLLEKQLGAETGKHIIHIARIFINDEVTVCALDQPERALESVEQDVRRLLNVNGHTLGLFMLALSRYDYIPTDPLACQKVSREWHAGTLIGPGVVRAAFERWQPWGGLAYWLWDWQHTSPPVNHREGETHHGNLAS